MGVFSKLKDLVGIEEIDDDEITEEEVKQAEAKLERKTVEPRQPYSSTYRDIKDTKENKETKDSKEHKVMPMTRVSERTGAMKLIVIEPAGFEDCSKLVDDLKAKKPVIINLVNLEPTVARKIFDFLSGATYALNGNVQKIADSIFVFAPESVDIAANVEHKSLEIGTNSKNIWR